MTCPCPSRAPQRANPRAPDTAPRVTFEASPVAIGLSDCLTPVSLAAPGDAVGLVLHQAARGRSAVLAGLHICGQAAAGAADIAPCPIADAPRAALARAGGGLLAFAATSPLPDAARDALGLPDDATIALHVCPVVARVCALPSGRTLGTLTAGESPDAACEIARRDRDGFLAICPGGLGDDASPVGHETTAATAAAGVALSDPAHDDPSSPVS